jgi:hypothetical protein
LREAIVGASSAPLHPLDGAVLTGTAALLEDLTGCRAGRGGATMERGVALGVATSTE